ncbi:dihydrodipicolinate synthase family protein [Deferrisoma palaeochoriense]
MRKLEGILPPVITPFRGDEVDLEAFRANLARWNETGLAGYLVLGSNGESVYLDEPERDAVLAAAREAIPSDRIFMAGTGRESTRDTVRATRRAAELGADCALVVTPHYFKGQMTQERLEAHFRRVADESPIPVLLYSVPQFTGVALEPGTVARLAEHPNIVGMKDSSGNIGPFTEICGLVPEGFAVFVGNAGVTYPALCVGAAGAILAVANCAPEACVALYEAFRAGDHARALDLQRRLQRLARLVTVAHGIGGLKLACSMRGYKGGGVRPPLTMPTVDAAHEIARELEAVLACTGDQGGPSDGA